MKKLTLLITHGLALLLGFGLGVYLLPILIAPPAPTSGELAAASGKVVYEAEFRRDLEDSDALHFGEGKVAIGKDAVTFAGELAPGPDYRLYFSPTFVETESDFARHKATMRQAGPVRTFDNFIVNLPVDLDPDDYTTVIVWCESFGQFITAAQYR